jgi:hypothetical protein
MIGWDQRNLASAANLSVHTIRRLEQFKAVEIRCDLETRLRIRRAFRDAGVRFLLNGVKIESSASGA